MFTPTSHIRMTRCIPGLLKKDEPWHRSPLHTTVETMNEESIMHIKNGSKPSILSVASLLLVIPLVRAHRRSFTKLFLYSAQFVSAKRTRIRDAVWSASFFPSYHASVVHFSLTLFACPLVMNVIHANRTLTFIRFVCSNVKFERNDEWSNCELLFVASIPPEHREARQ